MNKYRLTASKLLMTSLALLICTMLIAQQPRVGIGTQTPNPSAVLHLVAPNNNQGLLLPQLSTAQMQANPFLQSLGQAEKGLLVFDTDKNQMFSWDGAKWKSSANFSLPYVDSVENGPNQSNLFRLINKGNSGNAVGVMYLENRDPNNGFSPLLVTTNSIAQGAADFIITNQQNTNDGIGVSYRGLGSAGAFVVNNTASTVAALKANTNGVAGSVAIRGEATNGGTGVAGFSNGNTFTSPAIYGEHTGTGDAAGVFKISNSANIYAALFGETVGSGSAIFARQAGTGRAGQFQINNATNAEAAVRGFTDGLGRAGFFTIANTNNTNAAIFAQTTGIGSAANFEVNNTSSTVAALNATTNGTGNSVAVRGEATNGGTGVAGFSNGNTFISPAMYAEHTGTGDAAGVFKISNSANPYSALFGETIGSGSAIFARQAGTGRAGQFQINNVTNAEAAIRGFTDGLGRAGFFTISNGANTADAVYANSNGGGNAVFAQNSGTGSAARFEATNTASTKPAVEIYSKSLTSDGLRVTLEGGTGDAIFAEKTAGPGSAGNFQNSNASNSNAALFAATNAATGSAFGTANFGNGNAVSIFGGGLRLSTGTLSGGGNITTRNAAYEITGAGAYTVNFPLSNGETFFFYNNTASPVTVNSISIPANSGRTFIVLSNVLRGM